MKRKRVQEKGRHLITPRFPERYRLSIVYHGGLDSELDKQLRGIVSRPSESSGCWLLGRRPRDIEWTYQNLRAARRAYGKLCRAKPKRTIEVRLWDDWPRVLCANKVKREEKGRR